MPFGIDDDDPGWELADLDRERRRDRQLEIAGQAWRAHRTLFSLVIGPRYIGVREIPNLAVKSSELPQPDNGWKLGSGLAWCPLCGQLALICYNEMGEHMIRCTVHKKHNLWILHDPDMCNVWMLARKDAGMLEGDPYAACRILAEVRR